LFLAGGRLNAAIMNSIFDNGGVYLGGNGMAMM
jgi:hypothetical protein